MRTLSRGHAVRGLAAGGIAVGGLSLLTWVRATVQTVADTRTVHVTGATLAPAVGASALVILAAALALALTRRAGSVIAGATCTLAAGLAAYGAVRAALTTRAEFADLIAQRAAGTGTVSGVATYPTVWIVAFLACATLLLAAWTTASAGRWRRVASRYDARERPAAAAEPDARVRAIDDWDALGRGEDPTG